MKLEAFFDKYTKREPIVVNAINVCISENINEYWEDIWDKYISVDKYGEECDPTGNSFVEYVLDIQDFNGMEEYIKKQEEKDESYDESDYVKEFGTPWDEIVYQFHDSLCDKVVDLDEVTIQYEGDMTDGVYAYKILDGEYEGYYIYYDSDPDWSDEDGDMYIYSEIGAYLKNVLLDINHSIFPMKGTFFTEEDIDNFNNVGDILYIYKYDENIIKLSIIDNVDGELQYKLDIHLICSKNLIFDSSDIFIKIDDIKSNLYDYATDTHRTKYEEIMDALLNNV